MENIDPINLPESMDQDPEGVEEEKRLASEEEDARPDPDDEQGQKISEEISLKRNIENVYQPAIDKHRITELESLERMGMLDELTSMELFGLRQKYPPNK